MKCVVRTGSGLAVAHLRPRRRRRWVEKRELVARATGIAAGVALIGEREFNRRLHLKASFPSTVVREGRLLYAA